MWGLVICENYHLSETVCSKMTLLPPVGHLQVGYLHAESGSLRYLQGAGACTFHSKSYSSSSNSSRSSSRWSHRRRRSEPVTSWSANVMVTVLNNCPYINSYYNLYYFCGYKSFNNNSIFLNLSTKFFSYNQ